MWLDLFSVLFLREYGMGINGREFSRSFSDIIARICAVLSQAKTNKQTTFPQCSLPYSGV